MDYLLDLIIDPGHGGKDPGAVSGNIYEKDIALRISLYQLQRAQELGLRTGITRRTDQTLDLEQHAARVTVSRARVCLCNHINAGGGLGFEVYHSLSYPPKFAKFIAQELKAVGTPVHGAGVLTKESKKYKGKDYYRMHYTGQTETVIIEYGYIDNPKNLALIEENWQAWAETSIKAVCLYLGKTYTLPQVKFEPIADPNLVMVEYKGKVIDCEAKVEKGRTRANLGSVLTARKIPFEWIDGKDGKPNRLVIK